MRELDFPLATAAAACGECAAVPRRAFLCDAGLFIAFAALPVEFLSSLQVLGDEAVYPLPARDGAGIDKDRALIVVRYQNAVYAFVLWCPHQRTALRWYDDLQRFECPKHHSKYQPTGIFIEGRATRGMDRYALRKSGDTIVVDLATTYQQDKDLAGWEAAVVKL